MSSGLPASGEELHFSRLQLTRSFKRCLEIGVTPERQRNYIRAPQGERPVWKSAGVRVTQPDYLPVYQTEYLPEFSYSNNMFKYPGDISVEENGAHKL